MIKISLQFKLIVAFIFIASLVAGATYYQAQITKKSTTLFDTVIDGGTERVRSVEEMRVIIDKMYSDTLFAYYIAGTPTTKDAITSLQGKFKEEQARYRSLLQEGDKETTTNVKTLDDLEAAVDNFAKQAAELVGGLYGNSSARKAKEQTFTAQKDAISSQLEKLLTSERQTVVEEKQTADAQLAAANRDALIVAGLPILAALALGFLVSRAIARRLNSIKDSAQHIANGDFSNVIGVGARDEIGAVAATINQMSDRLKESYRRIALEKQRDEALLENISEGLLAIDDEGNVVLINSVAVELLQFPPREQLIGTSLADSNHVLFNADDKPLGKAQQPGRAVLKTGKPIDELYTYHRTDGQKLLLRISANPVVLEEKIVGAILLIRDVTKEKEVDRMKTEFISLASHQLRTPLSAIKWYTEMLLSGDAGKLTGDQTEFAQSVYDSSERMIDLVNSLLNISRIESGRIIVDPKPTDLQQLVSGIVTDLKAKTEEKQQTLIISVHKGLPKINLDPRLIGQVYMNLLTNAIKYTPKGGEISVFVSKKGNEVLSQVTDNGYGIPKSQHDKVFQKFFRAENIVKVETDGTGLGLYLIKAIVESSGGRIWFESDEGKGTTFWFTIPLSGMKAKEGEVTLDA